MLLILVCASFSGYAGITFHRMNNDRSSSAINKPAFGQKKDREDAENSAIKYEHSLPYNCTHETARLNAEKAAQDDPRLIYLIKRCYLEHPSTLPYELENPDRQDYSQGGQSVYVDELLNHTVS